jgi:hypothetical protein
MHGTIQATDCQRQEEAFLRILRESRPRSVSFTFFVQARINLRSTTTQAVHPLLRRLPSPTPEIHELGVMVCAFANNYLSANYFLRFCSQGCIFPYNTFGDNTCRFIAKVNTLLSISIRHPLMELATCNDIELLGRS